MEKAGSKKNVQEDLICVGMILGAHGIRGQVRLRSFTEDPSAITQYCPLSDRETSKTFSITLQGVGSDFFIAKVDEVDSREKADALGGMRLYATRASLPKISKKEQYYAVDLVDLKVINDRGEIEGLVMAVHDYGAGPFLEISSGKKNSFMLPFNDECFPEIDLEAGHVKIRVPEGWLSQKDTGNENG